MDRAVVLLSGGVDSTTLIYYVKKALRVGDIYALSFKYGQKHSRELDMAAWQARHIGVAEHIEVEIPAFAQLTAGSSALTDRGIAVPDMSKIPESERNQPITYVPNRNMIFLSIASAYAEAKGITNIFYGAQAQDNYGYWDCTIDFVEKINDVLGLNRKTRVKVNAPFAGKSKREVVRLGIELGVDYSHTWTCYTGEDKACGICPSCVERIHAFEGQ